jgi:hypothetical protein
LLTHEPCPNFAYLAYHDARLVALGTQAEQHFASDPTVMLFKLRQFGEVLAQRAAAKVVGSAILRRAFRDALVPQDLNDEPADVMLARLKADVLAEPSGERPRRSKAAE